MSTIPNYTIVRSARLTVSIHILQNGSIEVRAPRLMPDFLIRRFFFQHQKWIEKKLKQQKKFPVLTKKQHVNGEIYMFLGNQYQLSIGAYSSIHIGKTELFFPKVLEFRIQKELKMWYQQEAKRIITQRVKENAKQMNVAYLEVYFSDTKSKWGSCSHDNKLQFNWRLVMAPLIVLNYVVVHELAHIQEKNHSDRFWRLVERYTPSYKQHRLWLKRNGSLLNSNI